MNKIKEFHLFAGIGGGIYGGKLLGHTCCGGVEIDEFCKKVLTLRQEDGWMDKFDIYDNIKDINGKDFIGKFDVLCGGFPCQAFSHAAHGNNILEKNLWNEMYRFVKESKAPVVFAENVTYKAVNKARIDLNKEGYITSLCKLSCGEVGADHKRDRYWLMGVKKKEVFIKIVKHLSQLGKFNNKIWKRSPFDFKENIDERNRRKQLKAIGNAQSPLVVACIFRILVNRISKNINCGIANATYEEINNVVDISKTWIQKQYGMEFGFVHTPTTMANYSCKSMMKHKGCRNYNKIFGKPIPRDAEYLMGFPIGASNPYHNNKENYNLWIHMN